MVVVGHVVGRYEVIREIGRGGMATVYLARQAVLDREVALKELSTFYAASPEMVERFLRESQLAGTLNHPNIVTVHEYFEADGIPYIAMEYLPRGSLRPYVGRLSMAQVVGVLEGVLAGLAQAGSYGIVHRDLKPENVMLTADGRVKIADFGIAKATQSAGTGAFLTATGTTVGTPTYMAPEQAMGQSEDIGVWTDLYSVGIMAWELVVGHTPFADSTAPMVILMRQVNEVIPPAVSVDPEVDAELSAWIDRLLVKDFHERVQDPSAAWDGLEEIVIDKLGPRWRREARLPTESAVLLTPRPLTPAPFASQRARTPAPTPPAPARRSADAESGYVTFRPPAKAGEVTPDVPQPAEASPAEASVATPPAAAPPAATPRVVELATPSEAQHAAPPIESEYFTYGRRPEPAVVAKPPSEVEPRVPAEPPPPAEHLAGPSVGAAVTAQGEPEPIAEAPPAPEPAAAEPSAAAPQRAASLAEADAGARPVPQRRPALNPRRIAALTGGMVVAAVTGFLIAPASHKASPPATPVSFGAISLTLPAGWVRQSAPATPYLKLANELAVGPAKGADGVLVIGTTKTTDSTLLPAGLLTALSGKPSPQPVRLDRAQFYRYIALSPRGAPAPMNVYALPTTGGTVIGACVLQAAGAAFPAQCESALSSLRLSAGKVLALGPSDTLAAGLRNAVNKLNSGVAVAGRRLRSAAKARDQSRAADQLAAEYTRAAADIQRLNADPSVAGAITALASAMRSIGRDYSALSRAAGHNDGKAYRLARGSIANDERAVTAAFNQLGKLGYVAS
jgi:serine/threonine protein kinase